MGINRAEQGRFEIPLGPGEGTVTCRAVDGTGQVLTIGGKMALSIEAAVLSQHENGLLKIGEDGRVTLDAKALSRKNAGRSRRKS